MLCVSKTEREGRREGGREGGKEGRKGGREEGRKEGRKDGLSKRRFCYLSVYLLIFGTRD
jgi:flagellar biosynthesis/type III secretory pathway protein FliH